MATGFWGPRDNLHARVMIGLFAHVIEQQYGEPDLQPARLTADLYRLPDLSPVTVTTRLVRQGGRIKVIEAELFSGGVSSARASCQLLRRSQQPEAHVWSRPAWDAPPPEQVPPPEQPFTEKWEMRPILPPGASHGRGFRAPGPRRTWLREVRPLVGGETYTPFSRVATGIDFTSPTSNASDTGLNFINSDVTLYLARPPVGEWIGYEVADRQSADGIAVASCALHDIQGAIGFSSCAALAQSRR
ncbi:MAG TPA: acyl-CoA thioesterase domain-containing protein [Hyphomonadaceae bacterium]|nr:acyl-CoA thioesterase domain-containing protein [Hyphomonadaceae bacterium]